MVKSCDEMMVMYIFDECKSKIDYMGNDS